MYPKRTRWAPSARLKAKLLPTVLNTRTHVEALDTVGFGVLSLPGSAFSPIGLRSQESPGLGGGAQVKARGSGCLPGTELRLRDRETPSREAPTVLAVGPGKGQSRKLRGNGEPAGSAREFVA